MARCILGALEDLAHLIRYRFLLFAGLLPYCLGAAIAYYETITFDPRLFLIGLAGIFFTLVGVEAFNEYFDWILGTDRVFQLDPKPIGQGKLYIGIAAFFIALLFAIYLTLTVGLGILAFAIVGFIAAAGYLGPPVKFAYRGLGEVVIAIAYGPAMVLGSFYLQARYIGLLPLAVSTIPAIMLFSIAITNEVPDSFQDRMVGKKNICARIGRKKTVVLYGRLLPTPFILIPTLIALGKIPQFGGVTLLLAPLAYRNYSAASKTFESPMKFLTVIRSTIVMYVLVLLILIISYISTKGTLR